MFKDSGHLRLGGEGRCVEYRRSSIQLPECPDEIGKKGSFLRLITITHSSFGGWAPDWLWPASDRLARSSEKAEPPWVSVPGHDDLKVRLAGAVAPRWVPLSGWNYALHSPKKMRKVIPPGAVYLIQCQDPARASDTAQALWMTSLCSGQDARDGFGKIMVGNCPELQ
jgi:CRISPR type III-B/RAMP module-associated protein Cmr3